MSDRSASAVTKLILYFSAFVAFSCTTGNFYFGDYHSTNQQKIKIAEDSTFSYVTPGPTGDPGLLTGTWTRSENKLLLHALKSESKKLTPAVTVEETSAAAGRLIIAPVIGIDVQVEVLADGTRVGVLSAKDSSFVYEGKPGQLVLRAYASGLYASLFRNDTLYAPAIDFSGYTKPVLAKVNFKVALRDFYKVPVEDSSLKIKSRQKLYWEKKNTVFYWEE